MGCTSSTEVSSDPFTGEQKNKHKLGGSYPGNRRTPQPQQTLAAEQSGQQPQHFVSYGGGNALVLQQGGVALTGYGGQKQPQYVQVTLPAGVHSGQAIHVQAPDGKVNEIIVPEGMGPGSTFTVEFADAEDNTDYKSQSQAFHQATTGYETGANRYSDESRPSSNAPPLPVSSQAATQDDGFASGFGSRTTPPMASAAYTSDANSYPVAASDARPVYSSAPSYPSTTY